MSGHNRSRIHCLVGLILLGLVLVGCAEVIVINPTKRNARVRVLLPDGSGGSVYSLAAGQSATEISIVPGKYRVDVLSDEDYEFWLRAKQAGIYGLLQVPYALSKEEKERLEGELLSIEFQIEDLAKRGVSCIGIVGEEGSVTATLMWDDDRKVWELVCTWGEQYRPQF